MGRGDQDIPYENSPLDLPPRSLEQPDLTELQRVADGDTRPIITIILDNTQHTNTDEERFVRMKRLCNEGYLWQDPMRWHPPSYTLSAQGRRALSE